MNINCLEQKQLLGMAHSSLNDTLVNKIWRDY